MNNTNVIDGWVEGLVVGFEKEAAGGKITLEQLPINYMGNGKPDYNMLVDGKKVGKLYWNMKGYVAEHGIPLPSGRNLSLPEGSLASFKSEINKVNKEWKQAEIGGKEKLEQSGEKENKEPLSDKEQHNADEKEIIDTMTDRTPEQEAQRDADNKEWSDFENAKMNGDNDPVNDVVFKKFGEDDGGEVIALFPNDADSEGNITSYMHTGQHSAASPELMNELEDATPEEYNDLKNELINDVGYKLNVKNEGKETQQSKEVPAAELTPDKKVMDQTQKAWWDKLTDAQKAAYKAKHKRTKKATIELLKLANKLEGMGRVEEAQKIDSILKGE